MNTRIANLCLRLALISVFVQVIQRPLLAQSSWSIGPKTVLYMRVAFPDDTSEPVSHAAAAQVMVQASAFFEEQSYGLTSLTADVTPLLMLPQPKTYYSGQPPILLLQDARAAALEAGFDTVNYDLDIVRNNPIPGYAFSGTSNVGAKNLWLQHPSLGVLVHELGHNFGLHHSNFWRPTDGAAAGPGVNVPYGDVFDTMGQPQASPRNYDFNPYWKYSLGWLTDVEGPEVIQSGIYRLSAYDSAALEAGYVYALRVRKDAARDYWLSYRRALAGNRWLENGVVLNWNPWAGSGQGSQLLDATPGSPLGAADSPLTLGKTFSDREAGIHLTPVGKGQNGDRPWIDVYVHLDDTSPNLPPTMELTATSVSAAMNQGIQFDVAASDPDADELAYSWDFGDGSLAPNSSSVVHQWSLPGEYLVRCRVSDMKGGASSANVVVVIGAPDTLQVSGTVRRGVQPVEDVLVQTSLGFQTRTDSAGNYVLTGLATGDHTLSAVFPGTVLAPEFSNPVTLNASISGADFQATLQPPIFELQPQGISMKSGGVWVMSTIARGTPPLHFQWQLDEMDIDGALGSSLELSPLMLLDAGSYRVVVSNPYGTNTSNAATVVVTAPPRIVAQPQDIVANLGDTAVFDITVEGRDPLSIQWITPGGGFPEDGTNASFSVSNVQDIDAGSYSAFVFNDDGFVMSSNATLTVNHLPIPAAPVLERLAAQGVKVPASIFLGPDPDGDTVSLQSVGPGTANGGVVTVSSGWVFYTPPAGGISDDSFTFSVDDGRGGIAEGTATVIVLPDEIIPDNLHLETLSNGDSRLTFDGIPDRPYSVQYTEQLNPPSWQTLGTATADGSGRFSYTDSPPPDSPSRYYRSVYP